MSGETILALGVGLAIILGSAVLHEMMHAYTSDRLGDDTARLSGRLSFNPLVHLDLFGSFLLPGFLLYLNVVAGVPVPIFGAAKPVPFNPYRLKFDELGPAIVAVAGPLTNLALAVVAAVGANLGGIELGESGLGQILDLFIFVNLGFFVFNMIPFPPLDGSRILYAVAPESVRNVLRAIEAQGLLAVAMLLIFFQGPITQFVGSAIEILYSWLV